MAGNGRARRNFPIEDALPDAALLTEDWPHSMRHLTRPLLLVVVAFFGCAPKGPSNARYKFTAEGSGQTNALPLNPLRVGWVGGEATDRSFIDGFIETETGKELRMTNAFSGLVTRVAHLPDGLFFTASNVDGKEARPILIVPTKVRVGMKWEVFTEGSDPLYRYEVVERTELAETYFGPAVQWRIDQTDSKGEVIGRRYLEGRGSVDTPAISMWNEDPQVAADDAPKVEVVPFPVPDTFKKRAWLETLSLLRIGTGPGLFVANDEAFENGGQIGWCASYESGGLTPVPPVDGPPFRRTDGLACVSTQYCARVTTMTGGFLDCSLSYISGQASGALIGADGKVTWAARSNTGELAYGDMVRAGTDFAETSYRGIAVVPDENGNGNLLYSYFAGYGDLFALGSATQLFTDGSNPRLVPNNLLSLSDLSHATPLSNDTGGRNTLLLRTKDGMLWSATMDHGALSRPTQHVRLAGRLAIQATENGHEVLRVTGDGLIQRLSIEAGVLKLAPVAKVSLTEPGEQVHSAFLWREPQGTFLLVATLAYDGSDVRGSLVKVNFYRSPSPITVGAPVAASPVNSLRAMTAGPNNDIAVCWQGEAASDLAGWTIGGKPASAVARLRLGGPCVQVFRPPGMPFTGQTLHGSAYFTVEGPIPGMGKATVRSQLSPNVGFTSSTIPSMLAPLKGGGFVSGRRIFGAGGVLLGIPTGLLDSEPQNISCSFAGPCSYLVDAFGHGLWAMQKNFTTNKYTLKRLGLTSVTVDLAAYTAPLMLFASGGGGVVLQTSVTGTNSDYVFVAPDGTTSTLPSLPVEYQLQARTADGTLCGFVRGANRTFCRKPDGSELTKPMPYSDLPHLIPTDDGILVGLVEGDPTFFYGMDPTTAQLLTYSPPARGPALYAHGADGSLWGIVTNPGTGTAPSPVRFTKNGPVPVNVPAGLLLPSGENLNRLYPDESVLFAGTVNGKLITLLRPP